MQKPDLNVQKGDNKAASDGQLTTTMTYDQLHRCKCGMATFVHHRDYNPLNFTPFKNIDNSRSMLHVTHIPRLTCFTFPLHPFYLIDTFAQTMYILCKFNQLLFLIMKVFFSSLCLSVVLSIPSNIVWQLLHVLMLL